MCCHGRNLMLPLSNFCLLNIWFSSIQTLGNQLSKARLSLSSSHLQLKWGVCPQHPALLSCVLPLLVLPLTGHLCGQNHILTQHKLPQQEVPSFFCQMNKLKESPDTQDASKVVQRTTAGMEGWRDSLQQERCGMCAAVATGPGGAHPCQAGG